MLVLIEIMDFEGCPHPVEIPLDTGFTGYLTLPGETIRQLGLASVGTRSIELAEGQLIELEAYCAEVSLSERSTDAVVLRSDGAPRLGMTMLRGNRITMDVEAQGTVSTRAYPVALEPSLRAKRGNLAGARNATAGTRSPRLFAPRDDKMGTRETVSIDPLGPVASRNASPRKMGLFGRLLDWVKRPFLGVALGLVITAGIIVYAFGVFSLPLNFGEILTFMGIWLALGVLFGQTKPASMPLREYLERRIVGFACCYGFFVAIAIAYAFHVQGTSEQIKGEELFGLVVLSVVGFAAGFFAGLDTEPNQS